MGVPKDCIYTKDHEWAKKDGDFYLMGITDYAQDQLGKVEDQAALCPTHRGRSESAMV